MIYTCVELWGPSCCTPGKLVLLLLSSQAVQGYSCGCCSSSTLVSVTVCVPRVFLQDPHLQHGWDGVQSSQKGEALALPLSSLITAQTSPDLGLPILLGDPKFSSLRWMRGEYAAQALTYWVVILGLPHHSLHMHS